MSLASVQAPGPGFVVRLLDPRRPAESRPVAAQTRLEVAYALDADLVVRRPAMKSRRVALTLNPHAASVEVLEGEASILGQPLGGNVRALLPPYVPLCLGDIAIAYGEPGAPGWALAERLAADLGVEASPSTAVAAPVPALRGPRAFRLLGQLGRGVAASPAVILAAVLLGGALFAAAAIGTVVARPGLQAPHELAQRLDRAGFKGLTVTARPGQAPLVAGVLPDDASVARLMAQLDRAKVHARLAVTTRQGQARSVEDLFRSGGVAASATALGPGAVQLVLAPGADVLRVDALRAQALGATPGLKRLDIVQRPPPSAAPELRITAVVAGPDGYLAGADGARYFIGGVLPTGQVLTAIEGRRVTLKGAGGVTHIDIEGDAS